jgi:hypothetical protein
MVMVDLTILVSQVPTLDGGNFSSVRESTSLMSRTTKLLILREVKMQKVKPSGSGKSTMD